MIKKIIGIMLIALLFIVIGCRKSSQEEKPDYIGVVTPEPLPTKVLLDSYMHWEKPPVMTIDTTTYYIVTIKTEKGIIRIQLYPSKAPKNVNNVVFLIKQGFYNHLTFHRVISDFIAQAGKPPVEKLTGPGYTIEDEYDDELRFNEPGMVAMARSNEPDTNGSQFFITYGRMHWYNDTYTIIGKVIEGMEVVTALTPVDEWVNHEYGGDIIEEITVEESKESLLPPPGPTSELKVPVLVEGRPLAKLSVAEREYYYDTKPAMIIDTKRKYKATITTSKGTIRADLFPQDAPEAVNNFYIISNLGYYDNSPVSFILRSRYVLIGSPRGRPESDIGYSVPEEKKRKVEIGAVGYFNHAKGDRSGSGSNVVIMITNNPSVKMLTVFGKVTEGIEIVKQLTLDDMIIKVEVK
jgi:cyclophilin family peptidyl-prolyl cis-trans isomerase